MIKLKNLLAENMRRFKTKNLNEDEDKEYKAQQEFVRLNKISDAFVMKLRQLSNSDIDVKEDELAGNTSYTITQTIQRSSDNGRRVTFVKPSIKLMIDPAKETGGSYVNVDTGKIYADIKIDTNQGPFSSFSWRSDKTVTIDAGAGMFSKPIDEIVDELIEHLTGIFDLSNR